MKLDQDIAKTEERKKAWITWLQYSAKSHFSFCSASPWSCKFLKFHPERQLREYYILWQFPTRFHLRLWDKACMIRLCVVVGILCLCVTLSLGFAKSEIPCISTREDNPACGRSSKCHPLLSIPASFFLPHFSSLSYKCLKSFLVNNAGPLWKFVAEGWTLVIATQFVAETGNPWLLSSDQLRGREPPLLTAL